MTPRWVHWTVVEETSERFPRGRYSGRLLSVVSAGDIIYGVVLHNGLFLHVRLDELQDGM